MIKRALFHQHQLENLPADNFLNTFDEIIFYRSHEKITQQIYRRLSNLIKPGDIIYIDSITIAGPAAENFLDLVKLVESKNATLRLWFPESQFQLSCLIDSTRVLVEKHRCDDMVPAGGEKQLSCEVQIKASNLLSVSKKELDALIKATVNR